MANDQNCPQKPEEKRELDKPQEKKKGKFWDAVFYAALIALVLGVLVIKSSGNGAPVTIGGLSIQHVLTASMQDEIPRGSLVITRQVDPATLQVGDDISYMRNETTTVTHRIVGIIQDYQNTGQPAFETQGVMNREKDAQPVPAMNVVGKVIFHSYALGVVMSFLSRFWYLIVLFLLLFTGLISALRSWRRAHQAELADRRSGKHTSQSNLTR